jgi:4-hydroxybenzoate polyprenyltransferase
VKSSAIRLGASACPWLYAFYAAALGLMLAGGIAAGLGLIFILAMALPGLHLYRQIRNVRLDDPAICLKLFRSNRDTGALISLALLIGAIAQL